MRPSALSENETIFSEGCLRLPTRPRDFLGASAWSVRIEARRGQVQNEIHRGMRGESAQGK